MKNYFLPLIISLLLTSSCSQSKKMISSIQFADNIVIAHRGAWKKNNLPENSIASLKEAVRLGCAGSEFDVHLTADDSLVINHDAVFGGKTIEKTNYIQLAETKLSNGETIPTLYHYIEAGMQQNKTMLVLEIKPSVISKERGQYAAQKIVELVKKMQAEAWIMYISFDYDILKKILELDPSAKTAYLNGEKTPEELKQDKITGMDYHYSVFKKNTEWINGAKKSAVSLNAWTVNSAEDMKWFIENKFDYITTNEPELLFELVNKKVPR